MRIAEFKVWVRAVRPRFWLAGIPSIILGVAIAWCYAKTFNLTYFLATFLGVVFAMIGCYTFNEYFDFKSGVDLAVRNDDVTPFSAGSRVLPEGLVKPSSILRVGAAFWILAFLVGAYLTSVRGILVLALALTGFLTGAFYTSPPFKWAYRGLGETLIGLTYGPLITFGSCYVQLPNPPLEPTLLSSLIPGALITAVIWINQFPDYHADREVGKRNLVVRIGRGESVKVYILLLTTPYLIAVLGVLFSLLPATSLLTLGTLPLAYRNIALTRKHYDKPRELIPALKGTILLFISTTLLLSAGYILRALA